MNPGRPTAARDGQTQNDHWRCKPMKSIPTEPALNWLFIAATRGHDIVNTQEVLFLVSDVKYTRVVHVQGHGLMKIGLGHLEGMLAGKGFVRISRSCLVSLAHIANIRRNDLGQLQASLRGRQETLTISKRFESAFKGFGV